MTHMHYALCNDTISHREIIVLVIIHENVHRYVHSYNRLSSHCGVLFLFSQGVRDTAEVDTPMTVGCAAL